MKNIHSTICKIIPLPAVEFARKYRSKNVKSPSTKSPGAPSIPNIAIYT
jgi:hypothetical protein